MSRIRVEGFTISLDGYGAGPNQDLGNPLGVVAWILGRNMFGPIRGSWPDMDWKGWWGDNPPYHEALDRARDAANGMDVRIGGGASTIQQYLRGGLIDELHVAISPVLLGRGERLFEGIDVRALGYECVQFVASRKATHFVLRRQEHGDA